ncbi:hypothetical protein FIBSPDRAFT_1056115, partial [Athelia psychrophila]
LLPSSPNPSVIPSRILTVCQAELVVSLFRLASVHCLACSTAIVHRNTAWRSGLIRLRRGKQSELTYNLELDVG